MSFQITDPVEISRAQSEDWLRMHKTGDLSKLKVVKVAIETMNEDVEPRNAKSAFVYINFKGFAIRGMSEDFERKAIIRRVVNESTGCMSLLGGFSGEDHTLKFNPNLTPQEALEFVQNYNRSLSELYNKSLRSNSIDNMDVD
ncbi:hypothetical protein AALP_AA8G037600 [Arabis alpina]|uniref:Uncharacterized protein n=1 Tax=Arabis alpina TaxID=50452 RepID=A0A087G4T6_ARAAL|nr:hypothetical protein AALP_AA8G037600 [Arabis alpina]